MPRLSPSACDRLAQGDADILDGVMGVDVQIAPRFDFQIDQAVAGDLIEHVIEEGKPLAGWRFQRTIQVDPRLNLVSRSRA
jgi:hypothetical protein